MDIKVYVKEKASEGEKDSLTGETPVLLIKCNGP
jgi:hypothetical protein